MKLIIEKIGPGHVDVIENSNMSLENMAFRLSRLNHTGTEYRLTEDNPTWAYGSPASQDLMWGKSTTVPTRLMTNYSGAIEWLKEQSYQNSLLPL